MDPGGNETKLYIISNRALIGLFIKIEDYVVTYNQQNIRVFLMIAYIFEI